MRNIKLTIEYDGKFNINSKDLIIFAILFKQKCFNKTM